jgi:cytochrome c nitrite reductase small subunit
MGETPGHQGADELDVGSETPPAGAPRSRFRRALPWVLSVALGMLLGSSVFVLSYAEGLSYFSNDPEACANCHVMQPLYDTWQRSPHVDVAGCNDCHTPHDVARKYLSKARNGWNHSVAFTLQNFDEPIQIKPFNAVILEENCRECHEDLVNQITGHYGAEDQEPDCVRCHRDVGHAFSR